MVSFGHKLADYVNIFMIKYFFIKGYTINLYFLSKMSPKISTFDWDIVKLLEYAKNISQKSVLHEYYHKYDSSLPNIMFLGLYKSYEIQK